MRPERLLLPAALLVAAVAAGLIVGCAAKHYLATVPKEPPPVTQPASRPAGTAEDAPPAPLPAGPVAPADQKAYDEALALISRGEYTPARVSLVRLLGRFEQARSPRHTATTMFWLGYVAEKQRRWADARDWYRRLNDRFGGSRPARQGLKRLAELDRTAPGPNAPAATTQPTSRPAWR